MLRIEETEWTMSKALINAHISNEIMEMRRSKRRQPKKLQAPQTPTIVLEGDAYRVVAEGYFGLIATFFNQWKESGIPGDRLFAKIYDRKAFSLSGQRGIANTVLDRHVLADLATLKRRYDNRPSCWATSAIIDRQGSTPCLLVADGGEQAIDLPRAFKELDRTPSADFLYDLVALCAVDPDTFNFRTVEDLHFEAIGLVSQASAAAYDPYKTTDADRTRESLRQIYNKGCGIVAENLGIDSSYIVRLCDWLSANKQILEIMLSQTEASDGTLEGELYQALLSLSSIASLCDGSLPIV